MSKESKIQLRKGNENCEFFMNKKMNLILNNLHNEACYPTSENSAYTTLNKFKLAATEDLRIKNNKRR